MCEICICDELALLMQTVSYKQNTICLERHCICDTAGSAETSYTTHHEYCTWWKELSCMTLFTVVTTPELNFVSEVFNTVADRLFTSCL